MSLVYYAATTDLGANFNGYDLVNAAAHLTAWTEEWLFAANVIRILALFVPKAF